MRETALLQNLQRFCFVDFYCKKKKKRSSFNKALSPWWDSCKMKSSHVIQSARGITEHGEAELFRGNLTQLILPLNTQGLSGDYYTLKQTSMTEFKPSLLYSPDEQIMRLVSVKFGERNVLAFYYYEQLFLQQEHFNDFHHMFLSSLCLSWFQWRLLTKQRVITASSFTLFTV